MLDDILDKRELHIRRIRNFYLLDALTGMQTDRRIVEDGEDDLTLVADNFYAVFTS